MHKNNNSIKTTTTESYPLTVLEAGGPKSHSHWAKTKVSQAVLSLGALRDHPFLPLTSGGCRHSLAYGQISPICRRHRHSTFSYSVHFPCSSLLQ